MNGNQTSDAQMRLVMPGTLKDAFKEGCEKRGINMSALIRKDIEGHVQWFQEEDTQETAA